MTCENEHHLNDLKFCRGCAYVLDHLGGVKELAKIIGERLVHQGDGAVQDLTPFEEAVKYPHP